MINKAAYSIKQFIKHPLFLSFYLPSLLFAVAWGLRTPILPLYAVELSDAYGLVGLLVAGAGLGTLIADLPVGHFIDKMDKRLSMILGLTIETLTTLALIWVNSVWLALGLRFIGGMGLSIYGIARHAYITGAVGVDKRGRAISLYGGVIRVGMFIGPAIGGILAESLGLRVPFLAYTIICFVAIGVMLLAKDKFSTRDTKPVFEEGHPVGLIQALKGRWGVFSAASIAHILAQITRAGQSLILPLWGADILMLNPGQIGFAVSLSSAVSMTLFYPVGLIMDRLGRKLAIVPSFVIMGLGLSLLPLSNGYSGLLLVGALIGLGHGLGSGAMMTLGSDLSPKRGRSAYLGAWRWIGDAGSSGGPMLVGFVADALALPSAALVIAAAGFLAGGVFGFLVPETLRKKKK